MTHWVVTCIQIAFHIPFVRPDSVHINAQLSYGHLCAMSLDTSGHIIIIEYINHTTIMCVCCATFCDHLNQLNELRALRINRFVSWPCCYMLSAHCGETTWRNRLRKPSRQPKSREEMHCDNISNKSTDAVHSTLSQIELLISFRNAYVMHWYHECFTTHIPHVCIFSRDQQILTRKPPRGWAKLVQEGDFQLHK